MGWRFVNPALDARYGTETMPLTAENVARARYARRTGTVSADRAWCRSIAARRTRWSRSRASCAGTPSSPWPREHPRRRAKSRRWSSRDERACGCAGQLGCIDREQIGDAALEPALAATSRKHGDRPLGRLDKTAASDRYQWKGTEPGTPLLLLAVPTDRKGEDVGNSERYQMREDLKFMGSEQIGDHTCSASAIGYQRAPWVASRGCGIRS